MVKAKAPTIKINRLFYNRLKEIKSNKQLYIERIHNPLNPKSSKTGYYSVKAVDEIIKIYSNA